MIIKITDDFYLDLNMLYILIKENGKHCFATHICKNLTEITEEKYVALKNKIDEIS